MSALAQGQGNGGSGEEHSPQRPPRPWRVACVIVNYRTPQLTCSALASLRRELDSERDVAFVVENGSGDDSSRQITEWIEENPDGPETKLVESADNRGFAAGNNLVLTVVNAEYFLLLNSDARLRPGALHALLQVAQDRPRAGLIGVGLEGPDGATQTSCFRFPSPISELIDAAASGPITKFLHRWNVPLEATSSPSSPDWTSFACVMLRREALEAAGPMDENYFLYYEDVDYCRRVHNAGFEVACAPDAHVIHDHGGSSPVPEHIRLRSRPPAYLYESRARYFRLYYGRLGLAVANLLWTIGYGLHLARVAVGNSDPHVPKRTWLDIWRGFSP